MNNTIEQRSERAHARCVSTTFSATHAEEWRNKLAVELNQILARAEYVLGTSNDETDVEFAEAVLSVVDRVANFEEIERV